MIKTRPRSFLFEEVRQTAPERNGFDLSSEVKQTCRAGKLYPFAIYEAVPSDDFELQVEEFIRMSPMLSPTMHRVNSYWHWFFVPNRLCWNYWTKFISRGDGEKLPDDQDYTLPEPPIVRFYDLLYYSPAAARIRKNIRDGATPAGLGLGSSFDDILTWFSTNYPEISWKPYDYTSSHNQHEKYILGYVRTPRLANAIHLPDTALPLFRVGYGRPNTSSYEPTKLLYLGDENYPVSDYVGEDTVFYFMNENISLMPFTGLFRVWLEYYRDENLDDDYHDMLDYFLNLCGKPDLTSPTVQDYLTRLLELNYRCWEKDYFTTATRLPQKAPDVIIPGTGGSSSDLSATTTSSITGSPSLHLNQNVLNSTPINGASRLNALQGDSSSVVLNSNTANETERIALSVDKGSLSVSSETTISNSGGETLQPTTVAQVRRAFALQRWFEIIVRTGTRYIETIKAIFNSNAGDARLQRTEYIGGSSSPIKISDVVQTSATDDTSDTVQGNLAGYGIGSGTSEYVRYHAPEHGFVVGFYSILARTSYSQGIPRMFSRETWLDYLWPQFEHIGEQAVKQKEIAFAPLTVNILQSNAVNGSQYKSFVDKGNSHIFGYQSRYAEYKSNYDSFGGGFSSSLDFWSLGRIFQNSPSLSKEFVHASVSDRNFAVVGNDVENPTARYASDIEPSAYDEAYDYDTYQCDFWLEAKKVTSLTLYSEPI